MVKNKLLKKVAAAAMAMAMTFATVPMGAIAAHTAGNYDDGRLCDNTYRTYSHTASIGVTSGGTHLTSEGITCSISIYTFTHSVRCSVCNHYFYAQTWGCTTVHSKCGTRIIDH